jgi:ABC-type dipeptide/oligopeptide/nickel transport system ATPase component
MQPLLEVSNLSVRFDTERGPVDPVREVSFSVYPGQTLAVVGESGSGKSVTALSILRLIPSRPGASCPAPSRSTGGATC